MKGFWLLLMPLFTSLGCSHNPSPLTAFGSDTPIFIGLNQQAIQVEADWVPFLAQLDLAIAHNIDLVSVALINQGSVFGMQELNSRLGSRKVRLLVRFDLDTADSTLSDTWLNAQKTLVATVIGRANTYLPGRVIGYHPMALLSGECFQDDFVTADYANRVALMQTELAATIKETAGHATLVGFNMGYLYSLAHHNGGGHQQFETVLSSPNIDFIVAPYDYYYSRQLFQPFLPLGPMDSARLHNKIWITEDDTRTHVADSDPGIKYSTSQADDIAFVTRNVTGAVRHNSGLYLFDLFGKGWFNDNALWDAAIAAQAAARVVRNRTLVLIKDQLLATQPNGTVAFEEFSQAVSDAGEHVEYGIQSDVDNGFLKLSDYDTIIRLN